MNTKTCIDCGKAFRRSPADHTVRCPDCRKAPRAKVPRKVPETNPNGRVCSVVVSASGRICGEPAVFAFTTSSGEVLAECQQHHKP